MDNFDYLKDALEVFNSDRKKLVSYEYFYAKHYKNPYKLDEPIRVFYINSKPIGINAFMGLLLYINGEYVHIGLSNDTKVLSSHRGRGVFSKIVSTYIDDNKEKLFFIGTPNSNSRRGFKKMGWIDATFICKYLKILSPLSVKRSKNKLKIINNKYYFQIEKSEKSLFSDDDLYSINYSIMNEMRVFRSNEFFSWKQDYYSNRKFHYLVLRDNDKKMISYIVYYKEKKINLNTMILIDWFVLSDFKKYESELLDFMIINAKDKELLVYVPIVNINSPDSKVLLDCGFINLSDSPFNFKKDVFIVSPNGKKYLDLIKRIKYKGIDSDVF